MTRKRTDANQAEIVAALRKAGYGVVDLHIVGGGCPDLLVASKWGINVLVEVKMPGEKLNDCEVEFFTHWNGDKMIVYNPSEAVLKMESYDYRPVKRL